MRVNAREISGCWVVGVEGRLDISNASAFEQECLAWVDQGKKLLVLDFVALEYISSAGLRSILSAGYLYNLYAKLHQKYIQFPILLSFLLFVFHSCSIQ